MGLSMQSAARKRGRLERGEISNAEMFGNLWNLFRMRSFRKIMKLGADKCKRGQFVQEPGGLHNETGSPVSDVTCSRESFCVLFNVCFISISD